MSYAKSKNLTVYDVLTIASMIDKEVQVPSERALVAAVIYNRLHRGMPLGIDATTRFEFHNYTGDITESQLQLAVAVQHAHQRRPAADADRQPGPRRDPGGGPPGEGQLPLLRAEGERERPALLHRERRRSSTSWSPPTTRAGRPRPAAVDRRRERAGGEAARRPGPSGLALSLARRCRAPRSRHSASSAGVELRGDRRGPRRVR